MSTFLSAQSLTLSFTSNPLFEAVSFTVNKGDKIGLIGHNGCGKSSLMKLLNGTVDGYNGQFSVANQCVVSYVEQHLPDSLQSTTLLQALSEKLTADESWRAEVLLSELGFQQDEWLMPIDHLSGGQQMRLLLARAVILEPDLLLLDEPSNHLDLPSLLWLEGYLKLWKGSFVLVSHDQRLLDNVTNTTWIMRDRSLHHFSMPCSQAREALEQRDITDAQRHQTEQKEIDRLTQSSKRLAMWGKVYDNEDLARKAKTMQARRDKLEEQQTKLTEGAPWMLSLQGDALPANRLIDIEQLDVCPQNSENALFSMALKQVKSGDRVAVLGSNGTGKSTLMKVLFEQFQTSTLKDVRFHPKCRLGYYDQSLQQVSDQDTLSDALLRFIALPDDARKQALISAGFEYQRHEQTVSTLSGGERSRLLFVGLTLARHHLLFLDEPTNHLDIEGKQELVDTLQQYQGAALIVSHDRNLIEQGCNRFWLIENGSLIEYLDVNEVYEQMQLASLHSHSESVSLKRVAAEKPNHDEDQLLERLLELETKLEQDLQRKLKHQKPLLQQQWRDEIEQISGLI